MRRRRGRLLRFRPPPPPYRPPFSPTPQPGRRSPRAPPGDSPSVAAAPGTGPELLPRRLPDPPRSRVAVVLGGTVELEFHDVVCRVWPYGLRLDGLFRHFGGVHDGAWTLCYENENSVFASNREIWDTLRSFSTPPWYTPTVYLGQQADALVDMATRRDERRVWGRAASTSWNLSSLSTTCRDAGLRPHGLFLSSTGEARPLASIFGSRPRTISASARRHLFEYFDADGFLVEAWVRGAFVSERERPPRAASSSSDSDDSDQHD